jgi:peptide deformylase
MFATMYSAAGQGLAAPQVGRRVRVAVVDVAGTRCSLINPRITAMSEERARGVEGCLSIPGVRATVERPAFVTVEALDAKGEIQVIEAEGELARCLQHEIDHLDGVLYIDRLSALDRALVVARYRRKRGHDRIRTGSIPSTRA